MRKLKLNTNSIGFKVIFVSVLLAAVFLGTSFSYILFTSRGDLIDLNIGILEYELQSEYDVIDVTTKDMKDSLIAISETPPFQGIIRANKNEGYDEIENSTIEQWKQRLQTIFVAQMKSTNNYLQIRYLDENGNEIVRTDEINGQFVVLDDDSLQNKADQDYFNDTMALSYQEVYVSKTELNKEGTPPKISAPMTGVVRFATPVFDETNGERKGILITNVKFSSLVKENSFVNIQGANNYIVDENGFYMYHADIDKRWGGPNDLDHGENLFDDFPKLGDVVLNSDNGSIILDNNVFVYKWINIGNSLRNEKWLIITSLPSFLIFESINQATILTILFGFGTFVLLFFVYLFAIKKLLKPLEDLIFATNDIAKGKFNKKIKKVSNDEIGTLADALNDMTDELSDLYNNLDEKVQQRTLELNTEKSKMETIVESIGDGVFVVDSNGIIILFNNMCSVLSGYRKKETIGKPYKDVLKFVDEDKKSDNSKFIEYVLKSGKSRSMPPKTNLVRKDGKEISVADSASPLKNKNGEVIGAVVVFRDVSQEREIDRSKTEFVSLASHQLRTPLTAIMWDSEMLSESARENLDDEQKELLDDILYSNKRMIDLVNSLLNISRIDIGNFIVKPEECDVIEVTMDLIGQLKNQISSQNITLHKEFEEDLPIIMADKNLIRIIVQNLLTNAVKYTKQNGNVWIKWFTNKKELVLEVKDDGIGIPEEQEHKIFHKLFRADNAVGQDTDGNGLGLYLVKSVLDQVGGKISFESIENLGTTFTVRLPLKGMRGKDGNVELD